MGGTIETYCQNCGDSQQFTTGVGFMYSTLEKVMSFTTGITRTKLQDIVSNHSISESDYEHRVLACPSCNTLHERFYVRVLYGEDKVFETKFRCWKCRAGLVELDKPVEAYCCGKCGSQSLEEFPGICWD